MRTIVAVLPVVKSWSPNIDGHVTPIVLSCQHVMQGNPIFDFKVGELRNCNRCPENKWMWSNTQAAKR